MRYFFIVLILAIIYLNRSYAYFYYQIRSKNLPKTTSRSYVIGEGKKTLTMVSLGDSLTAGVGASSVNTSYPYLVAKNLSDGGLKMNLFDLAEPGAKTIDIIKSQLQEAISQDPDLVTILIGINDMHNFVNENQFRVNYQQIIGSLKSKTHARIVLINIPYLGSPKTLFFPYNLWIDYRTRRYNEIIKSLSNKASAEYVDLYSQTSNDFKSDNFLYSKDYFHPSDKGYILMGQIINANLSR